MFKHVIVRKPCSKVVEGISTANLGKPDFELAKKQHDVYIETLKKCGVDVTILESNEDFPDSCFVEDAALCTKKCVIMSRPGAETRRGESALADLRDALAKFYKPEDIKEIVAPGTIEPGDIMMVGDHFYIGKSARTNEEGARQMIAILESYGFTASIVPLQEVLHLKTGLAYLENNNLLVCGEFVTKPEFEKFNKIEIDPDEAYAANCIWINDHVLVPAGFPKALDAVKKLGCYTVHVVDTSEYRKIDGGLSCLSLRF